MNYKQAKQTSIWGFVGLNLSGELYINDVLLLDYVDVAYNIGLMVTMTYLLALLLWTFLEHHYTAYLLTKTTLRRRDVRAIFVIVSCQKMSKNVSYSEFNEIIDGAYTTCMRKMVGGEEEIYDMVVACTCVAYRQHLLELDCPPLPEVRQLENQYYDFVKIAESFHNYSR